MKEAFISPGSLERIVKLKAIFNSPPTFGKNLLWDGYTVCDAASVLLDYILTLPEPVIPSKLSERFCNPLRNWDPLRISSLQTPELVSRRKYSGTFTDLDNEVTLVQYGALMAELPSTNRQLLFYVIDLLAMIAKRSEYNPQSYFLAGIFQPGILDCSDHPDHTTWILERELSQDVLTFLIVSANEILQRFRDREYYDYVEKA